jgi:hypothetical protein
VKPHNDDGFADFQNNSSGQQQNTLNINNLYEMYKQNPHSANDKYSALDNMGGGFQQ